MPEITDLEESVTGHPGRDKGVPKERIERSLPEDWLQEERRRPFPDVLRDYMDARGIESLEELHRLYQEAGGKLDLGTFKRHARGEGGYLATAFLRPLFGALGLLDTPEAEGRLLLAYGLANRPSNSQER